MDIRLSIKGIVKFKALDTIFGHYNFVDIASYRECLGYFPAASKSVEIPEEKKKLLEMGNQGIDALFGESPILDQGKKTAVEVAPPPSPDPVSFEPSLQTGLEEGAYNLVFVKLKKGIKPATGLENVNGALRRAGLKARVVSWKKAFGMIGSMATIIKGALFVFVMLLFVVAVIIIVNTLTMTALERVPEIGMMRAVGAQRSFVSGMFLAETGLLSFVFGGAGIILGILVVDLIPLFNITSGNDMVQLLFGGDVFSPVLNPSDILLTVLQLTLVTLLSVIYPVRVVQGIRPLDAVARD